MTTGIEQFDKIIEDNTLYINQHIEMVESNLEETLLNAFHEHLGILEKWLGDVGEMADLIVPLICYKHAIKSANEMKEILSEESPFSIETENIDD